MLRLLLGNEAIAFGALSAGVAVAAGYPGTPSTEIIETLKQYGEEVYVEWSSNEKLAFENAFGAAITGARAIVAMKHVGLNVASDALMSASYSGVEGALVVVSADDPSMWSSQNEQDNRYYGLHALVPVIEPYDPQSAYDLVIKAFEISDELKSLIIFRTTTRVSHVRGPVKLLPPKKPIKGKLIKDPSRYVLVPENARRLRKEQLKRWERAKEIVSKLNEIEGDGSTLIIASGIAYAYVKEVVEELAIKCKILRLTVPVPLSKDCILKAIDGVERVLVVEELEPIVEMQLKDILYDEGIRIKVYGKELIGRIGELTIDRVRYAIGKLFNIQTPIPEPLNPEVPPRPPALCAGCPHRSTYVDLKKGLIMGSLNTTFFSGDIGCYTLGVLPPFNMQDTSLEMGSSLGIANGVYRATNEIPVAIIGDSTFFHSGLSGIANAVYNELPILIIILDNRATAMTGQQPSPSKKIDIEKVVKGLGVEYVEVIDPFNYTESIKKISEAVKWVKKNFKPAVVIAKRACALDVLDNIKGDLPRAKVDLNKCTGCSICYDYFTCPAIIPLDNKKAIIDNKLCIGCGACVPICPFKAISIEGEYPEGWDLWLK
ncbi:MAG: indolepyruvate ferredoxin oxidoreductase subunit alpha [Sulfolobales archaeon]